MSLFRLIARSAVYHWRTNVAVVLGVAVAVAVLAGALVVGESVRGSLRDLAVGRLGRTDGVLASAGFFREDLAGDVQRVLGARGVAPLIVASGFVTHEPSGRRASSVLVYGVDERFWAFHGLEARSGVFISPALARELGTAAGDVLLTRVQKPSAVPVESLFGRKDDLGRTVRLTLTGILPSDALGEFSLQPQQAEVRALFAPLRRMQRDLGVSGDVNTVLVSGGPQPDDSAIRPALRLEDLGARVVRVESGIAVESATGIVNEVLETAARTAGEQLGLQPQPVFTYLANTIRSGDRTVPYSLIAALDLRALPPATESPAPRRDTSRAAATDGVVLNEWTARELDARPGDPVEIEYYLWDAGRGLSTASASFIITAVVPIAGLAADRRLAPEYPGITEARSLADWDPPFPIDLSRVRPQDEKYWNEHRTTPKAFISYERGRDLWRSRYGALTSLRFAVPSQRDSPALTGELAGAINGTVSPAELGVRFYAARSAAIAASQGATDFGEYFTYFSFFLVFSSLLLAILFFRLGVEQRLRQIAILRASGFTIRDVRGLLLAEAVMLATAGGVLGAAGAVLYAHAIVYGLRTWWVGAVGTTLLTVHVSPWSLMLGAAGGLAAAVVCVFLSLRAVAKLSPRALLTAQSLESISASGIVNLRRRRVIAAGLAAAGALLLTVGLVSRQWQTIAFFGAGTLLLSASLLQLATSLRARNRHAISGRGFNALARLGFRGAAFRPGRSVLSAALIAASAFIIVSVDAFRRPQPGVAADRRSGSGGFALIAQSELPLVHDPNDRVGREALLMRAPELDGVHFSRFRLRQGQDASCLNLYRPTNPTIVAPERSFIESNRFTFSSSLAQSDAERSNPWLLLDRRFEDGAIPVIADATSLEYVLHGSVGDAYTVDIGGTRPLILRFVGALSDSVLQGQLVMGEAQFVRVFPEQQGYRFFLIEAPAVKTATGAASLAGIVERELEPFGVDAVSTADRIAAFHRVENTYLSTFQALGGLGLLLGTIGLAAVMFRNVLERRRELALLRAVGYDARHVSTMLVAEAVLLVGAGLSAGVGCAVLAVAPAWLGRGGSTPGLGLAGLLAAVTVAALLSSLIATRAALSGTMLDALRAE